MMSEFTDAPAWRDAAETPLMVNLPAGEFRMGETSDDKFANATERPAHRVRIEHAFALGCFPVTVGEFRTFRPTHDAADAPELPAVNVSWHGAQDFCAWLARSTGRRYRLPSEAEWEFACRAGSARAFSCGDEITPSDANYFYNESGQPVGPGQRTPAGGYPANGFGLYDLHGNVCEWIEDVWHPSYTGAPADGAAWCEAGDRARRVIRGGAWDYLPRLLRSSWRDWLPAEQHRDNLGFRVATSDLPA
jgi:formylglycine-generating enzyme required for sulfatase activity